MKKLLVFFFVFFVGVGVKGQNTFPPNGDVGIGTTTPNANLEIKSSGSIYTGRPTLLVRDASNRGTFFLESILDKPTDFVFKNNGIGRVFLSSRSSSEGYSFNIYTNPDEIGAPEYLAMLIKQTGEIGIGTGNPLAGLHLKKYYLDSRNDKISAILGNTYNEWTLFGGEKAGRIRGSNEGYLVIESNPNGTGDKRLYLNSGSDGNVIIANGGGTVGIGNALPSAKLEINSSGALYSGTPTMLVSDVSNRGTMVLESKTDKPTDFVFKNDGKRKVWLSSRSSSDEFNFGIYTDPDCDEFPEKLAMIIKQNGNIGIGRAQPSKSLDVKNDIIVSGARDILLDARIGSIEYKAPSAGGWTMGQKFMSNSNVFLGGWRAFGTPSTLEYYFVGTDYTNPIFKIKPNGNAALQGKFEATEIRVSQTPTADFVFEKDYNLRKLEDVEAFVKKNKHLPEIAPASEMEKNGQDLAVMNIKLLQKVEELTLYAIEQNKKIKVLEEEKTEIENQKTEIESLKELVRVQMEAIEKLSKKVEEMEN